MLLHSPLQRHPSLPVSIFNSAPFQLAQLYGAPHIMSPSKEISRPIIYAGSLISPPLLRCSLYPERDNGCLGRTQWEKVAFVLRSRCSGMTVFGAGTLARSLARTCARVDARTCTRLPYPLQDPPSKKKTKTPLELQLEPSITGVPLGGFCQ